jgi:hypothetical protein
LSRAAARKQVLAAASTIVVLRAFLPLAGLSAALALVASGCGGSAADVAGKAPTSAPVLKPHCAYPAGWQRLANRIAAGVYCPGWLPDPLIPQIGGKWNNINSVSRDRSYLESFVWQETEAGANGAGGELHVNLRGYPGRTTIPTCPTGAGNSNPMPCFAEARGRVRENGIDATLYTVNQGADQWHYALAWRHRGALYTLSEHLAPPLNGPKLVRYLRKELLSLVLIEPTHST